MIAHQKLIRDRLSETEAGSTLFGAYWDELDLSLDRAVVREVDYVTARSVIERYEWLGTMPAVVQHQYGIYFDGVCGGVVCYGPEYSENLGRWARETGKPAADWARYGFEGRMILLSRGACVHWAPPNAGSKLIRRSMALLPAQYEVVTATVDLAAGEVGTIYQAAGFDFVGSMRGSDKKDRDGWRVGGRLWGSRAMKMRVGSARWEDVRRTFPDAVKVPQYSKGRYFAFRGDAQTRARHRAAIAHLIKPYPKRAIAASSDASVDQTGEGGSQPTLSLHP